MEKMKNNNLLANALCGYMPHATYIEVNNLNGNHTQILKSVEFVDGGIWVNTCFGVDEVKPYLRPMSSMTDAEEKAYLEQVDKDTMRMGKEFELPKANMVGVNALDWLLEHHFDYRNLIESGLALVAPDDMYN